MVIVPLGALGDINIPGAVMCAALVAIIEGILMTVEVVVVDNHLSLSVQ